MTTGKAIKNARIKANMTQAALAEKLNVTPQNISQYERDIKKPKIETLKKIADALGVEVWELADFDIASRMLEYEGLAHEIKHDMMDSVPTWEEYKETKETKVSDIQMDLILAEMERERLNNLQSAFLSLNETGQKKAVENVEDLAKIPEYQKKDEPGQE